jgi:hypothetical protein
LVLRSMTFPGPPALPAQPEPAPQREELS